VLAAPLERVLLTHIPCRRLQLVGALKSKPHHSRGKLAADAINWAPGTAQVAATIQGSLMEDVSVAKENVVSRGNLERLVLASCAVGGTLLTIIGIRYFIIPESAAYTFGLAEPPTGYEMHYIIALRNVWLGLLAIAFVLFRQLYALALWFGVGVFVCFADAAIAASSSGGTAQVAFHMSSGLLCAGLAVLLGRIAGLATSRG
jgi:Domain of unknown function (DUF4267)